MIKISGFIQWAWIIKSKQTRHGIFFAIWHSTKTSAKRRFPKYQLKRDKYCSFPKDFFYFYIGDREKGFNEEKLIKNFFLFQNVTVVSVYRDILLGIAPKSIEIFFTLEHKLRIISQNWSRIYQRYRMPYIFLWTQADLLWIRIIFFFRLAKILQNL